MVRQGGVSWNQSKGAKSGIRDRFECKYCKRKYKMEWARNNHQNDCKTFNGIKDDSNL